MSDSDLQVLALSFQIVAIGSLQERWQVGGVKVSYSTDNYYHDDPIEPKSSKNNKTPGFAALFLLLVGGFFIQTTFASNISLNSAASVEFGQGILQSVACSGNDQLTVTPRSSFLNSSGAGAYFFTSVTVSGIPDNCDGLDFSINAYGASDSTPLALFNTSDANVVVYANAGTFGIGKGGNGTLVSSGSDSFTVTFTNPVATSASINRLTLQSAKHTSFAVGDRGPGNGIVYYVSANYFTSTGSTCDTKCRYLEVAPSGWNNSGVPISDTYIGMKWSTDVSTVTGQDLTPAAQSGFLNEQVNWAIGKGFSNTSLIRPTSIIQPPVLAYGATDSSAGQWFIPSMNELNELCKYARGQTTGTLTVACTSSGTLKSGTSDDLGGFVDSWYWSSSEKDSQYAWGYVLRTAAISTDIKNDTSFFRPVRAF